MTSVSAAKTPFARNQSRVVLLGRLNQPLPILSPYENSNLCNSIIVVISGALFTLSLLILSSQCENGAKISTIFGLQWLYLAYLRPGMSNDISDFLFRPIGLPC